MAGSLQARVYGGDLSVLCERRNFLIPPFLSQLMKYIEEVGMDTVGIYRLAASKMESVKLKVAIEAALGDRVELEGVDVSSATDCLKWYFNELSKPLIPVDMIHAFIEASKMPNEESVAKFACLVKEMPQINFYTLLQLIRHLKRITDNVEVNKMSTANMGIVFGPSLLRPEVPQLDVLRSLNSVVGTLIAECDTIFPEHEPVFGCDLHELFVRYNGLPPFLSHFINYIEKKGLKKPGLYEGSGKTTQQEQLKIDMLRMMVETGDYDLSKHHMAVDIVRNCIMQFFQELPDPLIPYFKYSSFLVAAKSLHTQRASKLAILVRDLPTANSKTLMVLMRHLKNVCNLSALNGMTPVKIGHIFGMIVMHPEEEMTMEAMQNLRLQNRIVEVMVTKFETVFDITPAVPEPREGKKQKSKQKVKRDPVFGVDLATKCESDGAEVPIIIKDLVEYLEKEAINTVGLYRCAANPAAVNLLRQIIETEKYINFDDLSWLDAHIVAETIKQYLDELPESLIPSYLHESFIEVAKIKRPAQKLEQYESLVTEIPDAHYRVLSFFLRHLKKIVLNKKVNKSSAANMGILFGSILMHSPDQSSNKKVLDLQNSVVEVLVRNYGMVFRRSFPIFGTDLVTLCKQERGTVPVFLTQLIEQIESKGLLKEVSIYRISGNKAEMLRIIEQLDEGQELDLEAPELMKAGNLTGVIKNYFAEMPEPVIPLNVTSELAEAAHCAVPDARIEKFAFILKEIPECNYCTLKCMIEHLLKVVEYSGLNNMTTGNLSVIFSLIWMRASIADSLSMVNSDIIRVMMESWPKICEMCNKYRYSPVFGCELSTVCTRENRAVPIFFEQCINHIEEVGLHNKDIYKTLKISSAQASVQALKKRIDQGLNLDHIEEWMTQQVVASCLKLYLKELPDPLIPYSLYESFIAVIRLREEHVDRVEQLSILVKKLDFAHYHTLMLLMGHFKRITDMSEINEMTAKVISVMFGQTIIQHQQDKAGELDLKLLKTQVEILRIMISEYDHIFH